mgnify:CR=1 FL=1
MLVFSFIHLFFYFFFFWRIYFVFLDVISLLDRDDTWLDLHEISIDPNVKGICRCKQRFFCFVFSSRKFATKVLSLVVGVQPPRFTRRISIPTLALRCYFCLLYYFSIQSVILGPSTSQHNETVLVEIHPTPAKINNPKVLHIMRSKKEEARKNFVLHPFKNHFHTSWEYHSQSHYFTNNESFLRLLHACRLFCRAIIEMVHLLQRTSVCLVNECDMTQPRSTKGVRERAIC